MRDSRGRLCTTALLLYTANLCRNAFVAYYYNEMKPYNPLFQTIVWLRAVTSGCSCGMFAALSRSEHLEKDHYEIHLLEVVRFVRA